MTMTIDKGELSRRSVLAGLGGMSFYFAIGVGGAGATTILSPGHSHLRTIFSRWWCRFTNRPATYSMRVVTASGSSSCSVPPHVGHAF